MDKKGHSTLKKGHLIFGGGASASHAPPQIRHWIDREREKLKTFETSPRKTRHHDKHGILHFRVENCELCSISFPLN